MILIEEFSFGNFWSFKDLHTLNLSSAKIKSSNPNIDIDNTITINQNTSLLKCKAIYGANSSGKSNVIRALFAFIKITRESVKNENILGMIDPFQLSSKNETQPSFFQLIFRINNQRYRYGFEATENAIKSEWLYSTPKEREQLLFIRENDKLIEINKKHFAEGDKVRLLLEESEDNGNEIFRPNSLFLGSVASLGLGKLSKEIINAISSISIINGLGHQGLLEFAGSSLDNPKTKEFIVNFLKYADVGIQDLDTIELSSDEISKISTSNIKEETFDKDKKHKIIVSKRIKYNENQEEEGEHFFSFKAQESEGTKKMFELSPHIHRAFQNGTPIIIDEFDSRFHPLLTKKIVELYCSNKNKNSQLIFTTHDTNLLSADLLRRDQIDFVEKDKYGSSHLYTLIQFKGIRNNASFEKDYIQGKYGAIPFLGDFNKLFCFE